MSTDSIAKSRPARIIVVGGTLAALVVAVEAHASGAHVDLFQKSTTLKRGDAPIVNLSASAKEFLKVCGCSESELASPDFDFVQSKLFDYVSRHASKRFRVLTPCKVSRVLLNKAKDTAVGVRYSALREDKVVAEANVFADFVVVGTNEASLPELIPGVNIDDCNKMAHMVCLSADPGQLSVDDSITLGQSVAKRAITAPVVGKIPHVSSYVDDKGVLHNCALSSDVWTPLVLQNRMQLNKFNHLLRFSLPNENDHMGLLCGQFIAIRAVLEGNEIIRFYSPVNRNSDFGHLDLMIKIEADLANKPMARLMNDLKVGETLDFKGPMGGFEYHRNTWREVGMIAGGTGITPMVQIIRSVANHPEDSTKLHLLYGNYNEDDILCKDELAYYAMTRNNIKVNISLVNYPPHWAMTTGFVDKKQMVAHLPAPADDIIIVLCGPPPMLKAMINMLKELGYTDSMIFSYL